MSTYPDFIKYPKIHQLGHKENEGILDGKLLVEEKIDGANFRFMLHEDKLLFGSRNTALGVETDVIGGNFKRAVDFVKATVDKNKIRELEIECGSKLIFCCENCVKHTIGYDWEKIPPVLGYDVWKIEQKQFTDVPEEFFRHINLPFVPVIMYGEWGKDITEKIIKTIPKSQYRDGTAEGIIIKNYHQTDEYGNQLFGKVIAEEFKEANHEAFGTSPKHCTDETEKAVATWASNNRIDKTILNMMLKDMKL